MKSIDLRSESAVKLLAEFLDIDAEPDTGQRTNAEHFAHGETLIILDLLSSADVEALS